MDDVHWVIRNARLHATDPALRTAAGFARALGDGAPHRAQVARWEGGQVALTHRLVRRYEEVLDLPHGQLLRAIDLITRDRSPINRMPVVASPVPDDIAPEALPLLERALQYEPMTGLDWDRLTTLLGSLHHVLVRERDWETLLYRLSLETAVSTGLEYVHRWEASARLVSMPQSNETVVEMIESALKDNDVQLYSDYSTLMRYSPDPRGHHVLADVIVRPPNARALWASLSTLTTLVRHHLVDETLVSGLLPHAVGILSDDSFPLLTRRAAASLAERSDGYDHGRVVLTDAERRTVTDVLDTSGLRPERQEATRRAIMRRLSELVPSDDGDPVLERLVRTSLEDPHLDSRDTTLGVLLLSSQGVPMGVELGSLLEVVVADDDMIEAGAHLSMLSWLVQSGSLDLLTVLTTDLHRPPEVTTLAAAALGNCAETAGAARDARDALLVGHARDHILLRRKDAGVPNGNAWGIGYALGMRGRFDLITELSQLPECERDRDWRPALAWWLDLPEVLRPTR